uniref:Putative secreted protein n=1 Tax=Ixodes scapularis TaxID=6945 RepID=A0A4D5RVK6_IXOSC
MLAGSVVGPWGRKVFSILLKLLAECWPLPLNQFGTMTVKHPRLSRNSFVLRFHFDASHRQVRGALCNKVDGIVYNGCEKSCCKRHLQNCPASRQGCLRPNGNNLVIVAAMFEMWRHTGM